MSNLLPKIRLAVGGGVLGWMITKWMMLNDYAEAVGGYENIVWATVIGTALPIILDGLIAIGALKTPTVEKPDVTPPNFTPPKPVERFDDALIRDDEYTVPAASKIDMARLRRELMRDEGIRYAIYKDSEGHHTAGIGHLLKESDPEYTYPVGVKVSEERVQEWFASDVSAAIADAKSLVPGLETHPQTVVHAVINMAFNLGRERLSKFTNTLSLINGRNYQAASVEALNSKWADQVGIRSSRIAAALAAGDVEFELA